MPKRKFSESDDLGINDLDSDLATFENSQLANSIPAELENTADGHDNLPKRPRSHSNDDRNLISSEQGLTSSSSKASPLPCADDLKRYWQNACVFQKRGEILYGPDSQGDDVVVDFAVAQLFIFRKTKNNSMTGGARFSKDQLQQANDLTTQIQSKIAYLKPLLVKDFSYVYHIELHFLMQQIDQNDDIGQSIKIRLIYNLMCKYVFVNSMLAVANFVTSTINHEIPSYIGYIIALVTHDQKSSVDYLSLYRNKVNIFFNIVCDYKYGHKDAEGHKHPITYSKCAFNCFNFEDVTLNACLEYVKAHYPGLVQSRRRDYAKISQQSAATPSGLFDRKRQTNNIFNRKKLSGLIRSKFDAKLANYVILNTDQNKSNPDVVVVLSQLLARLDPKTFSLTCRYIKDFVTPYSESYRIAPKPVISTKKTKLAKYISKTTDDDLVKFLNQKIKQYRNDPRLVDMMRNIQACVDVAKHPLACAVLLDFNDANFLDDGDALGSAGSTQTKATAPYTRSDISGNPFAFSYASFTCGSELDPRGVKAVPNVDVNNLPDDPSTYFSS